MTDYRIENPYNEKGHLKKWIWADCFIPALTVVATELMPPVQMTQMTQYQYVGVDEP